MPDLNGRRTKPSGTDREPRQDRIIFARTPQTSADALAFDFADLRKAFPYKLDVLRPAGRYRRRIFQVQETIVDRHRTGGMTAIAALNIIVGTLQILAGLFQLLGALVLMRELSRQGVFDIPLARVTFSLLILAAGVVGIIAGLGLFSLRPWARALSFVFAALLILSSVFSYFSVPILASIGTYDIGSISGSGLVRLVIFGAIYVVVPVVYSLVLCATLFSPAWKSTFAKGSTA
jgi:hypothetical protein